MMKITCDMCMDLMPLVQDGVASADSIAAVEAHIQACPDCCALYEGRIPEPTDSTKLMEQLKKQIQLFMSMVLMFGILFGVSLTAGSQLFLNSLIMPMIGCVGYYLLRWKALYKIPLLLLVTHLVTNTFGLIRGVEHLDIPSLLLWCSLYALFSIIGVVIAGLLHFAFRKETEHE